MLRIRPHRPVLILLIAAAATLAMASGGCLQDGRSGAPGLPGPPGPGQSPPLERGEDLPGLVVKILEVTGGSLPGGRFRAGDRPRVRFTVEQSDGTPIPLGDLDYGGILVSGPTSNYQLVIDRFRDLATASLGQGDGSYVYRFQVGIPAVYPPPLNDSPTFGADHGELQGQPLLSGTYTVGSEASKYSEVDGEDVRDAGNAVGHFLFGDATVLEPRDVVKLDNCNRCHGSLRAHGGIRREIGQCLLCHTAGSEDGNNPGVAGGTPGVTVDFGIMIHRIHNGAHLPSVLGVATLPNGDRDYGVTPVPYEIMGHGDRLTDFSEIAFPIWPNLNLPMPRDAGYSGLSSAAKAQEDEIRCGVTDCNACHGDPDGSGPLTAPAQGDQIYSTPNRWDCGSCHDDVNWDNSYTANVGTMGPQPDDKTCAACHPASGGPLAIQDGHLHPLLDDAVNPGLNFTILDLSEAGLSDGDGTLDPGEKVQLTFTITDDDGLDVDPLDLDSITVLIAGPMANRNLLLSQGIPEKALGAGPTFVLNVPMECPPEFVGDAGNDAAVEVFTTLFAPHWVTGASTIVSERTGTGGVPTSLTADARAGQNFVEVLSTAPFARNDWMVLDDGLGAEEYVKVALVDGSRLWFQSPLAYGHALGASIVDVTLTERAEGADYTLNASTGEITEMQPDSFLAGNAIVVEEYTSDFVLPGEFPSPLNDSPDIEESWGEWSGKAISDGTYTLGLYGYRDVDVTIGADTTTYHGTSLAAVQNFLVGAASAPAGYGILSATSACNACHSEPWFHGGGRRGVDNCLLCHGTAGSEDRPRYVAANAPDTTGVVIEFRNMLHKIHMGKELEKADTYTVVGYGRTYPNNFSLHTYGEVGFSAMPGGVMNCTFCHGEGNAAWITPADRSHPLELNQPARVWRSACASCHDGDATGAHVDIQTSGTGVESCAVCHGLEDDLGVEKVHKPY